MNIDSEDRQAHAAQSKIGVGLVTARPMSFDENVYRFGVSATLNTDADSAEQLADDWWATVRDGLVVAIRTRQSGRASE